jgi:hypothetical protein
MAVALTQQQAPPRSPAPVGSLLPQGGRGGGPKACRRKGSGSSHIYPGTTISPRMRRGEGSSAGFESIDKISATMRAALATWTVPVPVRLYRVLHVDIMMDMV